MLGLVETINKMIDQLDIFAVEVKKVAREVGTEGKLGGVADVGNVQGIWQEITCVRLISPTNSYLKKDRTACPSTQWLVI